MTLFKQLWLAVFLVITLSLLGSFLITVNYGKNYIESQLSQQNSDAATRLALAIGSGEYNEVRAELQIASLFDTGQYQRIELMGLDGTVIFDKEVTRDLPLLLSYFSALISINDEQGVAHVTSGWKQIGTLSVQSNVHIAYRLLWSNSVSLCGYLLILGLLCGAISHYFLYHLMQPLKSLVKQAQDLGERRFTTIPPPKTLEFRRVVVAMNTLSERMQDFFEQGSKRLSMQHAQQSLDTITGLYNREAFITRFDSILARDDESAAGLLVLIRVGNLHHLNTLFGRDKLDQFLAGVGELVRLFSLDPIDVLTGRLDGGDIALLFPCVLDTEYDHTELLKTLNDLFEEHKLPTNALFIAETYCTSGELFDGVYQRLEQALRNAVNMGWSQNVQRVPGLEEDLPKGMSAWRSIVETAFKKNQFELQCYPVLSEEGTLLHYEAPVRLADGDRVFNAGQFLPWIKCLKLTSRLDMEVLSTALNKIEALSMQPIGLNLSAELLMDSPSQGAYVKCLQLAKDKAQALWLEFPEAAVFNYLEEFKVFATRLKALGCKVGIEHAGYQIEQLGKLHDVGLDFIKMDGSIIRNVHSQAASQLFVQGVVTICHSIGVKIIAEGVVSENEQKCLWSLGFDGVTGPFVTVD